MPFHDVRPYLRACLESLARQTLEDLEFILVDDGSTDGSSAVAEEYCASDPRFRLVIQENLGCGLARNTGVPHANGEYLTFVDADDVVHHRAYERLVGSLAGSGSDFAIGTAARFGSLGVTPSYVHQQAVIRSGIGTHISQHPELVLDRMAWNKVYRRTF
ncbi:MAG TPA: glycosyltransferase family 2 protein [Marmoricola sp.]|nr:glycosyltransferase family 2 protein [Marmoricola sp.]